MGLIYYMYNVYILFFSHYFFTIVCNPAIAAISNTVKPFYKSHARCMAVEMTFHSA